MSVTLTLSVAVNVLFFPEVPFFFAALEGFFLVLVLPLPLPAVTGARALFASDCAVFFARTAEIR